MCMCVLFCLYARKPLCVCVCVCGRGGKEGKGEGRRVCIGGRGICGVVKWSLYEGKGNVRRRGLCQGGDVEVHALEISVEGNLSEGGSGCVEKGCARGLCREVGDRE